MGVSATKGEDAASPPRPNTDCLGPSPALAIAASGMEVKGMVAKLKNMEAVAKPLTKLLTVRGDLGCSADMRMTLEKGGGERREDEDVAIPLG